MGTYPLTPVLSTENSTTTITQKKRKTPDSRSDSSAALPNFAIRQTLSTTPGAQSVPELTVTGMRTNHQEIKQNKHYCTVPKCGKSFLRQQSLNRHTKQHTGEKKFGCDAPALWKKIYGKSCSSKRHHGVSATNTKRSMIVTSPGCQKKFSDKNSLVKHKINIHNNLNSLSAQTSSSGPVNYPGGGTPLQSSAPASTVRTMPPPLIPTIVVATAEKGSPGQVFPTQTGSKNDLPGRGKEKRRKKTRVNVNPVSGVPAEGNSPCAMGDRKGENRAPSLSLSPRLHP